jgi:hypothetical protein
MRMNGRRKVKWVRRGMREGDKTLVKILLGIYKVRGQLGDLTHLMNHDITMDIRRNETMWTAFTWLKLGPNGGGLA